MDCQRISERFDGFAQAGQDRLRLLVRKNGVDDAPRVAGQNRNEHLEARIREMKTGSIADFLVRVVLDEAFREQALADPKSALEGFDVSEEEKEILCSRDHRVLGLLGDAITQQTEGGGRPAQSAPTESKTDTLPELADVKLVLRLAPQASEEGAVSYAASLQPWTADAKPAPDSATDEQAADAPGTAPGEVAWIIRVVPTGVEAREDGLAVSYAASIQPLPSSFADDGESDPPMTSATAGAPWNHHVESSAAKNAAKAVAAAEPDQRYGKLLALVHALQTGDDGG